MRHALLLVLLTALAAGCSGPSARDCTVKVGLVPDPSAAQMEAVQTALRSDDRVERFVFVSKEEGLEIMREKFPELIEHLDYNPLPGTFEVTVAEDDASGLAASLRRLPGVENVQDCPRRRVLPLP